MKTLLAFLAIALCCSQIQAQNIEHQIVASQYGSYKVPTVGNGFAFPPDSCQVSGGGKNFPAFTAGVPIKVVDANPAQIEVDTPVAVNLNNSNCSVSMTTTYQHTSFYLTSGTGGLQEALNAGQVTGGANTVILDQQWYSLVAPSNPATVIAAVKGNTLLGLVDVTTTPYTAYSWNGSAYAQIAPPGSLPSGNGIVKVAGGNGTLATPGTDYALPNANTTGTAGNLSGTPALPNGTTGTTQATGPCDTSGKLATDQFVVTCAGTASFPASGGVVVNTNQSASRNATETDITNLLGGTSNTIPQVLTSTPPPTSGPTAKTCAFVNSGSTTSVGCTWSAAPAAGETIACTVFGATGNSISIADGANTYTPYGSGHTNSSISTFMQTFYTAPISAPVTTTTATLTVSSTQPGILCNSAIGIAPTSPTDGQVVVDGTSAPVTTGALTTTANGDYIFCTGVGGVGSGFSTGGGFTLGAQFSPFFNSINQYFIQPTAGSITPSITGSVTTSASLLCSAFKKSTAPTTATTAFTSAAPLVSDNVVVVNVKEWGAIGNGSSHPACTTLGLSTLTQLHAYQGGIYSFATSCNNEMDWLATQYAVNKLTGGGGTVKMAGGTYVWDQPVILPLSFDNPGNAPGLYIIGDGLGGTFIVPNVPDFGPNSGLLSCGPPTASYADNGGAGSGRYSATGCFGGLENLTFNNPFTNGTANVTDTGYMRGIINVPAPSYNGTPIQMDGVLLGGRVNMRRVGSWGFRAGFNMVGDHMTWDQINAPQNLCGFYWAPQSIYLEGDLVMQGHDFVNGDTLAGFCIDKDAQMNLYDTGELYVGYQPYAFLKFPGTVDSYLGSGYFGFMEGGQYENIQAEDIGNAVFWDDNMTQSGGGVGLGETSIQYTTIYQMFTIWNTSKEITAGGRKEYAWIGSGSIEGMTLKNPFSCCGSFQQGGDGQIAGILAQFSGAGGGLEIDGDISDALSGYSTMPLVGNTRYGGYCAPVTYHTAGQWDGGSIFLDPTVSSVTAGQALQLNSSGNAIIANGTATVVGIAAQTFTNPGTGQCLAYAHTGNFVSPFTISVPGGVTPGSLVVATTSGNGLSATSGYVIGTALTGGTTPTVALAGMGSVSAGAGTGNVALGPSGLVTWNGDLGLSRFGAAALLVGNGTGGDFSAQVYANIFTASTSVQSKIWLPTLLYSAAGTALPTCNSGIKGTQATVSDATSPTYNGTYASGGTVTAAVICNGTNWVTH